jgi:MYXO-CTERM domain-containing protein
LTQTYTYSNGNSPTTLTNSILGGIINSSLSLNQGVQLNITGNPSQVYTVNIWGTGVNATGTMTATLNGTSPVSLTSQAFTTRVADQFTFSFQPDSVSDLLNIKFVTTATSGISPFVGIQAVAIAPAAAPMNPTLATSVSSVSFGGLLQNAALPTGTGISINNTGGTSSGSSVAISAAGATKFTATAPSPANIPGSGSSTSTIGLAPGATAANGTFNANVEYSAPGMTNALPASTVAASVTVGNATYASGDSSTTLSAALTAPFSNANNIAANLSSTTTGTAGGSSPVPALTGSTATILRYDNTTGDSVNPETISMRWRTRTAFEANFATNPNALLSDVVDLTGMTSGSETSMTGTGNFVLQMSYMSDLDLAALGLNEAAIAASGELRLGWNDSGTWKTAVSGNKGTFTPAFFNAAFNPSFHSALGSYGVNTDNNTVWAVLNHNSEFAVIPEPSTLMLGGLALLGLAGAGLRRRRMAKQSA